MMATIQLPQNSKLSSRTRLQKKMLSELQMPMALKALNFMIEEMCAEKGFKRQSGAHYYHHLVDVTQMLLNFGIRDEITITVGELHDSIEDVEWINYEYIKREYGVEVADAVQILSKDPNINYKVDIEKLQAYLIRCFSTLRTALAKTADRVHNFGTLGATPLEKQLRVALETEAHFFPLFKWAAREYPEYAAFFLNAKTTIEPHLEKIKEQAKMQAEYEAKLAEQEELISKLKNEAALSKVEKMQKVVDNVDSKKEYIKTIDILNSYNKQMESALKYYSDPKNYETKDVMIDYGRKAAKALQPLG